MTETALDLVLAQEIQVAGKLDRAGIGRHYELREPYTRLRTVGLTDHGSRLWGIRLGVLPDLNQPELEFTTPSDNNFLPEDKAGYDVIALEASPLFPELTETEHLLYLPGSAQIDSFQRLITYIKHQHPEQTIVYAFHKNGDLPEGRFVCSCSGGDVQHIHLVALPRGIESAEFLTGLEKLNLINSLQLFDPRVQIELSAFRNTTLDQVPTPLANIQPELPGYRLGVINNDGKTYETGLDILKYSPVPSGFLRRVIFMLANQIQPGHYSQDLSDHFVLPRLILNGSNQELRNSIQFKLLGQKQSIKQYFRKTNNEIRY